MHEVCLHSSVLTIYKTVGEMGIGGAVGVEHDCMCVGTEHIPQREPMPVTR